MAQPDETGSGGLPVPDPYPEYVACPACGEPEVEVWCYQDGVRCHACGAHIPHPPAPCLGSPACLARRPAS